MTSASVSNHQLSDRELDAVGRVMESAGVELDGRLRSSLIAGGRSNLTYRISDGARVWVLRMPPRVGRTPSAHDVAREHRVVAALAQTAVPVPRAVVLCEDESLLGGAFAVSEFVTGRSVQTREQLDKLDDAELSAVTDNLVHTLATLHAVDHRAVGLERFGRPDRYAERQLARWSGQWNLVGEEPLLRLGNQVIDGLGARMPEQRRVGIVHGDFRIDNTLLRFDTGLPHVAAVVDWELSTIGDPVADVAMMCGYRDPAFDLVVGARSAWTSERLPQPDELASAYESASGTSLDAWDFHSALAHFKIAVIAAGIAHRTRAGGLSGPGFDTAGQAVAPYLELALSDLGTLSQGKVTQRRRGAVDDPATE